MQAETVDKEIIILKGWLDGKAKKYLHTITRYNKCVSLFLVFFSHLDGPNINDFFLGQILVCS